MNDLIESIPGTKMLREELRNIELEVLTSGFTLADAMREGSRHTGQPDRAFINVKENTACALSAALISATVRGLV
jgi:hypothetical protein